MSVWLECDSDLPSCRDVLDEAIVQDISQAANKVHILIDPCSSRSPDSGNIEETNFDSALTEEAAADAVTTCIRWLENHRYPDANFVGCRKLRDYAAHHS